MKSKLIAEFIGTFALVFAGCGALMVAERFPGTLSPEIVPLVFGLIVAVMIYAVGHISGAHFNPAVTLGFTVAKHFPPSNLFPYWGAQFGGGIVACLLLNSLLPPGETYGATLPTIGTLKAMEWEMVLTFFLMFVIMAVATDSRAVGTMAGSAIGGTVMVCAFFGGPVTGASMNPARSLGPNMFQGETLSLWIYFVGPLAGAVLAAWIYEKIRCDLASASRPGSSRKNPVGCC
ncbi:MAG: aquaporin [Nitrospinae bacterium CG11_big_fil_rev_8_21_14_0_20_56_8]|nr:MAG: aquaporin [Nitrospinae bacterium CG11_big_fil_rev_8_21_14_0_20_56_8]